MIFVPQRRSTKPQQYFFESSAVMVFWVEEKNTCLRSQSNNFRGVQQCYYYDNIKYGHSRVPRDCSKCRCAATRR